jgi:transposase
MKTISASKRMDIIAAVERYPSLTQYQIALMFSISRSSVKKLLRLYKETGSLEPKLHSGGRVASIDEQQRSLLLKRVEEKPHATLEELRDYLAQQADLHVHIATISRALQRAGLPRRTANHGQK